MYFYIPNYESGEIHPPFSLHLISCHIKTGDSFLLTDLKGNLVEAVITSFDQKKKVYSLKKIGTQNFGKDNSKHKILFQARTDKLYLEKLAEVAPICRIDTIYIFDSDFSQKQSINLDRLDKIVIRSCEQSHNLFKPEIQILKTDTELLHLISLHSPVVLDGQTQNSPQKTEVSDTDSVLVGPEGGWSKTEIKTFSELGLGFENLGNIVYPAWLAGFVWFNKVEDL